MKAEDFDVVNRGNWLEDHKTLKDYSFENKLTIMIYQKSKSDEMDIERSNAPIALPGPSFNFNYNDE